MSLTWVGERLIFAFQGIRYPIRTGWSPWTASMARVQTRLNRKGQPRNKPGSDFRTTIVRSPQKLHSPLPMSGLFHDGKAPPELTKLPRTKEPIWACTRRLRDGWPFQTKLSLTRISVTSESNDPAFLAGFSGTTNSRAANQLRQKPGPGSTT